MKLYKILPLVLALVLLIAPLMVIKPAFSVTPVNFEIENIPIAPTTNINTTDPTHILEIPNSTALNSFFNITIQLTGATVANVPLGVAGLEVHLDFSAILPYASIVGFNDLLGQPTGVLNAPVIETMMGIYLSDGTTKAIAPLYTGGVQYIVAAASTGGAWNGADGLVVVIKFKLNSLPDTFSYPSDPILPLTITFSDASDPSPASIPHGNMDGTLQLQRTSFVYPPIPVISIAPSAVTGTTSIGDPVIFTVSCASAPFWDVAGYDVIVTWNSTLLTYVTFAEGTFLGYYGDATFAFNFTTANSVEVVSTRLSDSVPYNNTTPVITAPLFTLTLATNYVGSSYPALTCHVTLAFTDLVSWAHSERSVAPWFNLITAVDMPYSGIMGSGPLGTHTIASPGYSLYTAGVIPPGAFIDLYDQYPAPYGGQGLNIHSDSFAPQAQVCLYANVTYGGDRISNKLVVFQVNNALGQKVTILQNYTDIFGIATVCFRLPMSDYLIGGNGTGTWDPAIFGLWNVTATVEVDQVNVTDSMSFEVGWLVQVMSVTSNSPLYHKYAGDPMNFTVDVRTIHEQLLNVLVSIDTYDVQTYPIGETAWWVTVQAIRNDTSNSMVPVNYIYGPTAYNGTYYGWGGTLNSPPNSPPTGWTPYGPYEQVMSYGTFVYQYIPTWTRVGTASVVGYALTDFPANGGTPYGPQSNADGTTTTFVITKY